MPEQDEVAGILKRVEPRELIAQDVGVVVARELRTELSSSSTDPDFKKTSRSPFRAITSAIFSRPESAFAKFGKDDVSLDTRSAYLGRRSRCAPGRRRR